MGYDVSIYLVYGIVLNYSKINQMRDLHKLTELEANNDNDLEVFSLDDLKFLGYKYEPEKTIRGDDKGPELYALPVLEHGDDEFLDRMAKVCGSTPRWYIFQDVSY